MQYLHKLAREGLGGMLAGLIMSIGSVGLWAGTPLLWLWVGSQVEGSTDSLSAALAVAFIGMVSWVGVLAWLLGRLSAAHRDVVVAAGRLDPGHRMLERVLVVSAAIMLVAFGTWFFLFAGASPFPIGLNF